MPRVGSWIQRARPILVGLLAAGLLVPGLVVANETSQEFQAWENRPWGILEHVHKLYTRELPATPDWRCGYSYQPSFDAGALRIVPLLIGGYEDASVVDSAWGNEIELRLPLEVDLRDFRKVRTNDEAHSLARDDRDTLFIGFTGTYHRGPRLNERMEGFACANLAIVTGSTECAGAILAHEVGHALGLRHSQDGLMRPRDVACDDRLLEGEHDWIVERYGPKVDEILPVRGPARTEPSGDEPVSPSQS